MKILKIGCKGYNFHGTDHEIEHKISQTLAFCITTYEAILKLGYLTHILAHTGYWWLGRMETTKWNMHKIISPSNFCLKCFYIQSIAVEVPNWHSVNWNTQKWDLEAKFWEKWWWVDQNMAKGGLQSKEWKLRMLKSMKMAPFIAWQQKL